MAVIKLQSERDRIERRYYEYDPETDKLGEGGMGIVYKGRLCYIDTGKTKVVAIKALNPDLPNEVIERARKEAGIKIFHDNLILMLDFLSKNGRYYVISEYLEGETLDKRLARAIQLSVPEALNIIKNVLLGLSALHDRNFVHRDIDPSNIMICTDGRIKIIDLGVVKDLSVTGHRQTMFGQFIGKYEYASSEQLAGLQELVKQTSDIYSTGIVLYELVTGRLPFTGTIDEIVKGHREKPIPLDSIPDKKLQDIIGKATNKTGEKRYRSVYEFIAAIEDLQWNYNSSVATSTGWQFSGENTLKETPKHRSIVKWLPYLAGGVAVAMFGIFVWVIVHMLPPVSIPSASAPSVSAPEVSSSPAAPIPADSTPAVSTPPVSVSPVSSPAVSSPSTATPISSVPPPEEKSWQKPYNEALSRASEELALLRYSEALNAYRRAYDIHKEDSIAQKIKSLELLVQGRDAFIRSDYAQANSSLRQAENSGQPAASYYLGEMYYEGLGVPKDFKKGFASVNRAYEMGYQPAGYRLGLVYQNGIGGIAADKNQAARYFADSRQIIEKEAETGNPEGLYMKGNMYMYGNGVTRSVINAVDCYRKAAEKDYPAALYELYVALSKENPAQAMDYLTRSAKQGYVKAQSLLGRLLIEQRDKQGYEWLRQAADKDYSYALAQVGILYFDSKRIPGNKQIQKTYGIVSSDALSQNYLQKALKYDSENYLANYGLGLYYYTEGSRKEAEKYFKTAQKQISELHKTPFREGELKYPNMLKIKEYIDYVLK